MESSCDSQAGGVREGHLAGSFVWLAAYTKPRFEQRVKEYCEARGVEVFLPTHQSWRRWSDRRKLLSLPLFPSYVFMRLGTEQRLRAMQAPGFLWFVRNRCGPVHVEQEDLVSIRRLLTSGLGFDPMPGMREGDEVEIVSGAMRGCRARLVSREPPSIVLVVRAICASVRVMLPDPSWVVPVRSGFRGNSGAAEVGGRRGARLIEHVARV